MILIRHYATLMTLRDERQRYHYITRFRGADIIAKDIFAIGIMLIIILRDISKAAVQARQADYAQCRYHYLSSSSRASAMPPPADCHFTPRRSRMMTPQESDR